MQTIKVINADVLAGLATLPSDSVDCAITSPPYWGLRDYGNDGQIGLEKTPEEYVAKLVAVFREVRRVLKPSGTVWLNLGDSYAGSWGNYGGQNRGHGTQREITTGSNAPQGSYDGLEGWVPPTANPPGLKQKDLVGIPWRVAFALQADGWWLRQDIIWAKPNPMPESVTDRCTKSHEYIFLLAKSKDYFFDNEAIKEPCVSTAPAGNKNAMNKGRIGAEGWAFDADKSLPEGGRNRRSVWTITTKPYKGAHFATFPMDLVEPMVKAGCPKDGVVLDPFVGSGTTLQVAKSLGRSAIGIELNPAYIPLIKERVDWGQQGLIEVVYDDN
jgi:DNA modification methylase